MARRVNRIFRRHVYTSRLTARILFKAKLAPFRSITFFELPTAAVVAALRRELRPGLSVLDVGTGPYAIVTIWLASRVPGRQVATDIDPVVCAAARASLRANACAANVVCMDLLGAIDARFDLVVFVPPCISKSETDEDVLAAGLEDDRDVALLVQRSCGGPAGWETIDRFLAQVGRHLAPAGRAVFCINLAHVDAATIRDCVAARGLRVVREETRFLSYVVFVTALADAP